MTNKIKINAFLSFWRLNCFVCVFGISCAGHVFVMVVLLLLFYSYFKQRIHSNFKYHTFSRFFSAIHSFLCIYHLYLADSNSIVKKNNLSQQYISLIIFRWFIAVMRVLFHRDISFYSVWINVVCAKQKPIFKAIISPPLCRYGGNNPYSGLDRNTHTAAFHTE